MLALRKARRLVPATYHHPGQPVIDRLLADEPPTLNTFSEQELPYLLQAVRWFEQVRTDLPTPRQIDEELESRRVRSSLRAIGGADFRGRAAELAELRTWYQNPAAGPLLLTGIGGLGKSALLAHFATHLPEKTLLLWLDFDHPYLAPNNAQSVLRLLAAQISLQKKSFVVPEFDSAAWRESTSRFARALAALLAPTDAPLLVLDGFEVAQYATGYNEIWELLDLVLAEVPALRIVVSGRVAVPDLRLRQLPAQHLRLSAMADADATAWLRENGLQDGAVQHQVLALTGCVPLALRLAVQLLHRGLELPAIPKALPQELVKGVLYQRVLHRLVDQRIRGIAQDALVLRYLTEEVLAGVLHTGQWPDLSVQEVFQLLAQELSIVSEEPSSAAFAVALPTDTAVLYLRPEVRAATLRLLEADNPERVRILHIQAATWYGQQDQTQVGNIAELIYHSLRAGDISTAAAAWRDECARLLQNAVEDLKPSTPGKSAPAQEWLQAQLQQAATPADPTTQWEGQMLLDIPQMIAQGDIALATRYLSSRDNRLPNSPLLLYDAWLTGRSNPKAGRQRLGLLREVKDTVGRNRTVLAAYFAAQSGDVSEADQLLARLDKRSVWDDAPDGMLAVLGVQAARVRLATCLPAELKLSELSHGRLHFAAIAGDRLKSADVMLPVLTRQSGQRFLVESVRSGLRAPIERGQREKVLRSLGYSQSLALTQPSVLVPLPALMQKMPPAFKPFSSAGLAQLSLSPKELVDLLVQLGQRRWQLGLANLFEEETWQHLFTVDSPQQPLAVAIIGTLTAFRGAQMSCLAKEQVFPSIDHLVQDSLRRRTDAFPASQRPARQAPLLLAILRSKAQDLEARRLPDLRWLEALASPNRAGDASPQIAGMLVEEFGYRYSRQPELAALGFYLLGPDPLELLCRQALQLPYHQPL